jgi:hypothetical protein
MASRKSMPALKGARRVREEDLLYKYFARSGDGGHPLSLSCREIGPSVKLI